MTSQLKREFITTKVVNLVLEQSTDLFNFPAGKLLEKTDYSLKIELDTHPRSLECLLAYALEILVF